MQPLFLFRNLFLATVFALALFAVTSVTYAEGTTLSISPSKYDLQVDSGQLQQHTLRITNQSDIALPIKTEVMDFAPKDNKGGVNVGVSMPGRSAVKWFSVDKTDLLLAPNESEIVTVTISPPSHVTDGSYFALVMFQAMVPTGVVQTPTDSSVAVVPWMGTLFLLSKGQVSLTENALTITDFYSPKFTTSSSVPVVLEVQNNTNFHISPQANFELKTPFGGTVVAKTTIDQTTIMPGMSRIIEADITRSSPFGLYRPQASVQVQSYHKSVNGPMLYVLTVVGMAILGLFFFGAGHSVYHSVRYRTNYHRRFQAMWQALRGKL